jgi:BirA family biotin operon repressor/biotin-[acetyl-CoA-carboxylase] ligase
VRWFGREGDDIARLLDVPRVAALRQVESTMDAAHQLASEGAPAGTLVLAEEQRAGRGRAGRHWASSPNAGIWMTLIERPADAAALDVLSLRVGLALAPSLERWTPRAIQLKWPNDLYCEGRKLAGVLIEARWRDARADWVAIGVGINLEAPAGRPEATALDGADAFEVLAECLPRVRAAAFARGPLRDDELLAFASRDFAFGRAVEGPVIGTARGISSLGALRVETPSGVSEHRAGSLVFAQETTS